MRNNVVFFVVYLFPPGCLPPGLQIAQWFKCESIPDAIAVILETLCGIPMEYDIRNVSAGRFNVGNFPPKEIISRFAILVIMRFRTNTFHSRLPLARHLSRLVKGYP